MDYPPRDLGAPNRDAPGSGSPSAGLTWRERLWGPRSICRGSTWGTLAPRQRTHVLPHRDPARQCSLSARPPSGLGDPGGRGWGWGLTQAGPHLCLPFPRTWLWDRGSRVLFARGWNEKKQRAHGVSHEDTQQVAGHLLSRAVPAAPTVRLPRGRGNRPYLRSYRAGSSQPQTPPASGPVSARVPAEEPGPHRFLCKNVFPLISVFFLKTWK